MTQRIQLIIFDLDGTLVDAYKAVSASVNYTLKYLGIAEVDDYTIQRNVGWGDRNLIKRFVAEADVDKALSIFRDHHKCALKSGTKFLPGAKKLLRFLKEKGYTLAIASNRPSPFSLIILNQLAISDYFDYVLCADQVTRGKPYGDMLLRIMEQLAINKENTLYIGDMTIDAKAGEDAKVRTVVVLTGSSTEEEVKMINPFAIIRQLSELPEALQKINGA